MDVNVITEQNSPEQDLSKPEPETPVQPSQDMGDYLDDYQAPKRGDICKGVVIGKDDRGLIVDVGLKREGLVPASDLERLDDETSSAVQVGSEVTVFVLQPEDRNGYPILSIHQAQLSKDWIKAEEMMASGAMYESQVSGYNRGGLIVKFGKIRGFVPASQIVDLPKRLSPDDRRQRVFLRRCGLRRRPRVGLHRQQHVCRERLRRAYHLRRRNPCAVRRHGHQE